MPLDLSSTNRFLGIIAIAHALEVAAIIAVCVGMLLLVRQLHHLAKVVEEQQIAPAATRVHAILDDLHDITSSARALVGWARRRESE